MIRIRDREQGAALVEYLIAVSVFIVVVLATSVFLGAAIRVRTSSSGEMVNRYTPCGGEGGHLTPSECQ